MDNVEMAIAKLCASKVYTSSEFKREKDNFQSLCKNMERTETKRSNANMFQSSKAMFHFYKMVDRNSGDFDKGQKCGGTEGGGTKTEVCH